MPHDPNAPTRRALLPYVAPLSRTSQPDPPVARGAPDPCPASTWCAPVYRRPSTTPPPAWAQWLAVALPLAHAALALLLS
jgi:hypothetical protein